jgi:hypothetical protein
LSQKGARCSFECVVMTMLQTAKLFHLIRIFGFAWYSSDRSRNWYEKVRNGQRLKLAAKRALPAFIRWKAGGIGARLRWTATGPWSMLMNSNLSLPELEDRIATLRDNIRQLVEQAAGAAGSENEERAAERI